MEFLCVTNKSLADRLISNGNKLFRFQKDIEGNDVWFFQTSHISFDIEDAIQSGEAFFSKNMGVVF